MDFTIRPVKIGDGMGINNLRRMPGVFENTLGIPSERVTRNENYIVNMDQHTHMFVAVINDDLGAEVIIGCVGLTVFSNPRLRHSASIGIMVHKDFQDKGVGTALMKTIVDLADNWLMLVRVELGVFVDNQRAIHLYEKFGFNKEGIKKMAAIRNGKYVDEILMARINCD